MQNRIKNWAWIAAVVAALGLGACGGGGAEVKSEITTTTKGQQLLDLQKAYEAGAMTKDEYERERKRILDGK
jgi:hypothetical protein